MRGLSISYGTYLPILNMNLSTFFYRAKDVDSFLHFVATTIWSPALCLHWNFCGKKGIVWEGFCLVIQHRVLFLLQMVFPLPRKNRSSVWTDKTGVLVSWCEKQADGVWCLRKCDGNERKLCLRRIKRLVVHVYWVHGRRKTDALGVETISLLRETPVAFCSLFDSTLSGKFRYCLANEANISTCFTCLVEDTWRLLPSSAVIISVERRATPALAQLTSFRQHPGTCCIWWGFGRR